MAARVLVGLGAGLDRVRQQVVQLLANAGAAQAEQVAAGPGRIGQQAVTAMVAGGPGFYREEPAELVRVVPLAREVFHGLGFRMVLISLEVWSGWLDLRYALLPDGPPATPPMQEVALDWQLTDSTTRTYELAGAASGGGRLLRVHHLTLPARPARGRGHPHPHRPRRPGRPRARWWSSRSSWAARPSRGGTRPPAWRCG